MSPVEILMRKIVLKEQYIYLLREDIALLNKQVAEEAEKEKARCLTSCS